MDDQEAVGPGGPEPALEPLRADPIAGELVTETLDYDGGRHVTVYVPPHPPETVVFAGDGESISQWGGFLEAVLGSGRRLFNDGLLPATMRPVDLTVTDHGIVPGTDEPAGPVRHGQM